MLTYLIHKKDFVQHLFCHLNLGTCVTDILARLCTVHEISRVPSESYNHLRKEIVQYAVNALD